MVASRIFLVAAAVAPATLVEASCLNLLLLARNEWWPKQSKQTWLHMQLGLQIPSLRSFFTSEAIWRQYWPLRPPKGPQNEPKTYKQYAHSYVGN